MSMKFTQDEIQVRMHVKTSFVVTLGLYDGAVTKETVAEHIARQIEVAGGIGDFIEHIDLMAVEHDDGTVLAGDGAQPKDRSNL